MKKDIRTTCTKLISPSNKEKVAKNERNRRKEPHSKQGEYLTNPQSSE